jgi:phosphomannomutase
MRELQAAVIEHRADLGFAFDGDGDRIGVVDASGQILWPDQVLLLLATDVLARSPGVPIVADVKSSRTLFDGIAKRGGRAVMAPSGYVLVRKQMLKSGAPLAGEMSGHILFAEAWHGADDALYVAMKVLCALTRLGCSLASFRSELPSTVSTPEIRMCCPRDLKAEIVREVAAALSCEGADVNTVDGVRVTTADGWWLLRASGTESKLTVRCEATTPAGLARLQSQLGAHLQRHGLELPIAAAGAAFS